ncbi:hypothetical protein M413DRAFT_20453 [Hebeloma cylindrosporum]|uniref:Cytochrome P450 n=1 Tax=Hebeloma cylindrosporum TaxID=76867 RepID=A0A0C2XFF0_HEBCY|nr:hypothetical protein M413DRAFT_20453 [Hebeloma cylindrosporum h7]
MSIIYGLPPLKDSDDPRILLVNRFVERALAAAAPGAFLVEYFTWMEHLPRWMSPWRRYAEDCFSRDSIMFEKLFSDTKHKIEAGDATDSVAAKLIEDQRTRNLTDKDSAWISATVYSAGAETSSGQLAWFILAMVLHPEAQERAQDEIDSVVGRDRLPTFQDYEQLPYVRALVKEVMRWRGVSPLGIPHRLCQDDWYNGHFLPKDTTCIVNSWQLNHDPDVYGPDADDFRPGRHLDESGKLMPPTPETKDESHVSYGFGRRWAVFSLSLR